MNQTTILYGYQNTSSNDTRGLAFLRLNSHGRIQAQSQSTAGIIDVIGPAISTHVWTHIVQTYSPSNGSSLYIIGTLSNQTPIILRLGSAQDDVNNTSIQRGQYQGWMDEFRVYSRELSSAR